jgi:DNA end-binding protein Ku
VLAMIERKAQGEEIVVQPTPEEISEPAPDLMSALKASLEAVRAREGAGAAKGKAKPRKPAATKASAPKAAGAKAASVKKPAEKKAGATRRAATKR